MEIYFPDCNRKRCGDFCILRFILHYFTQKKFGKKKLGAIAFYFNSLQGVFVCSFGIINARKTHSGGALREKLYMFCMQKLPNTLGCGAVCVFKRF